MEAAPPALAARPAWHGRGAGAWLLALVGSGIRITLATPYGASAADLRDGSPSLACALEAAGVHLLGLQVKHEEE